MKSLLRCSKVVQCAAVGLAIALSASEVRGAAFTLGNLVVVQSGNGSAALTGDATAAFLNEFSVSGGSPIQTIALPTAVSGLNQPLTLSGTATSEGFLTLSANGQFLTMSGYGVAPGFTTPQTSTPTLASRVVGLIGLNGSINTTTALGDAYNGSNIRSSTSTDGISLWTAGNGGSGQGATAGVRSSTLGGNTSVQQNSTTSNNRVVNIFNGQLYVSASSGTILGVATVGAGLPTGSAALTLLPGMPTTGTHSSYDFWFKDANTLFVADDGSAANGGGIQKWTFSAGNWSLSYTLLNNGTTTTAVRGLAGTVNGNGDAVLFGTTGSALITVTDTGASAVPTTLATAPANTAFRGVEFLAQPVPEPSSMALAALGVLALFGWRFRQRK
jgi:MYXO-CTERM domain-containing protein